ncbi:MBOAT, membrane-bound O-acyltransferase family-domain-containing protein [Lophiotrema nucula]|uniref:O-acyltransferase n=1 Tax=Lophiotrema nucula TaxID=690887 RepID=A0A6A5YNN7_9PLEO|nr:MBOAT, membrane-bound O-acyltransferase family-domain-containing protein [Lophiotrema nucula]
MDATRPVTFPLTSKVPGWIPERSVTASTPSKRPRTGSDGTWTPDSGLAMEDPESSSVPNALSSSPALDSRSPGTTDVSSDAASLDAQHRPPTSDQRDGQRENSARRRRSVQVIIEESDRKGNYTVTADDPEFREIMRSRIEREAAKLSGRSGSRFRSLVLTRQFTTFDRQNPRGAQSPFHGFFTLFWLAMALMLIKVAAQNYKDQGSIFGRAEIWHMMVDHDLLVLLITDGLMALSTGFGFLLQKAIASGYLFWSRSGWLIQSIWQAFFTGGLIWFCFYRDWSWTHTVFIVLHNFVMVMKQHSYAFYNGYMSQVRRRIVLLEQKYKQLEKMEANDSPSSAASGAHALLATGNADSSPPNATNRRQSFGPKHSTNFSNEESEIATMMKAIEAGEPLDAEQIQAFALVIKTEIAVLEEELRGNCSTTSNTYPRNLTLGNFIDWMWLPTLVYDLEYPRQEKRSWTYILEKTAATLGVIWIMIIVSQAYLYPVVIETVRHKQAGMTLDERWKEFPWVLSDMIFPMLLEYMLAWYVIWECVLNVLAELTSFADRGFYGDWWNSTSWDQFAREWNRPVHNFLLRHVYHSSISAFRLSKTSATFMTFFLSAVIHELLMFCIFKKVRGYLFALQLLQVPLAMLSKTRLMKNQETLGNIVFWFGIFLGPSLIASLYLIV